VGTVGKVYQSDFRVLFDRLRVDLDDLRVCLKSLPLQRDLLLLPINNNPSPSTPSGGTHWSVLVYDRRLPIGQRFLHLDSSERSGNFAFAQETALALAAVMPKDSPTGPVTVTECTCAQQTNASDCAVYALAFCERIAAETSLLSVNSAVDAASYRRKITREIERLRS
jgi:hypothetical protein